MQSTFAKNSSRSSPLSSERSSSPLLVQQPSGKLIDRRPLIAPRHILSAFASGIPTLPAFPALLVSLVAERAVRTPASAIRARRRHPIVMFSSVVATFTDRHIQQGSGQGRSSGSSLRPPVTSAYQITGRPPFRRPRNSHDRRRLHRPTEPPNPAAPPKIRDLLERRFACTPLSIFVSCMVR